MFDTDIVIVSRLAGVLESALQTETYLSRSQIAEQVGMGNTTFNVFLKNREKLAQIVAQFQLHTCLKNRLYKERKVREVQKKQQRREREESGEREVRRHRRLKKLLRWRAQWKYDKAVDKIQRCGLAVTLQAIAHATGLRTKIVSAYLRRHPHLSKRYGLRPRKGVKISTSQSTSH